MIAAIIPAITSLIGTAIDKAIPDKAQAEELKAKITLAAMKADHAELKAATDIILAEAKGESWLQRNWRPVLMLWFAPASATTTEPTGVGAYAGYFAGGRVVLDNNQYIVGRDAAGTGARFLAAVTSANILQYGGGSNTSMSLGASESVFGGGPVRFPSYTVAGLPPVTAGGGFIFVSDDAGGATVAFSDGTNWRRVQDRAIVS